MHKEGWRWLEADERMRDDIKTWRKLLESPYDDVRSKLVAALEKRSGEIAATGGVDQLSGSCQRVGVGAVQHPARGGAAAEPGRRRAGGGGGWAITGRAIVLPVFAVAVRSVRGPRVARRAGRRSDLFEQHAELRPVVAR